MQTLPTDPEWEPEDAPEDVAQLITNMLARPVQMSQALEGAASETPPEVMTMRIVVSREIVDRLTLDKRSRAQKRVLWRALTISWTEHLLRWGAVPEDCRELYDAFVDTYEDKARPNIFDLRRAWLHLLQSRADRAERERNTLVRQGRTLTDTLKSSCLRCLAGGYERMYDAEGVYKGVRPGCRHEPIAADRLPVYLQDEVARAFHKAQQWAADQPPGGADAAHTQS